MSETSATGEASNSNLPADYYGYDPANLRATKRRLEWGSFAVLSVLLLAILIAADAAMGIDLVNLELLTAAGIGALITVGSAFLGLLAAAGVRRASSTRESRLLLTNAALSVSTFAALIVLAAVSGDTGQWLLGAIIGTLVGASTTIAIAAGPVTVILSGHRNALEAIQEASALPAWATPLSGEARWSVIGFGADLLFRTAAIALLWVSLLWAIPIAVLMAVEVVLACRGLVRGRIVLWLAPTIVLAVLTAIGAITVLLGPQ